jgi:hypothetical protein
MLLPFNSPRLSPLPTPAPLPFAFPFSAHFLLFQPMLCNPCGFANSVVAINLLFASTSLPPTSPFHPVILSSCPAFVVFVWLSCTLKLNTLQHLRRFFLFFLSSCFTPVLPRGAIPSPTLASRPQRGSLVHAKFPPSGLPILARPVPRYYVPHSSRHRSTWGLQNSRGTRILRVPWA